jgi:hypothetical protein
MLAYISCQMSALRGGCGKGSQNRPAEGKSDSRSVWCGAASFLRGYQVEDPIEFPARLGPSVDGKASGFWLGCAASVHSPASWEAQPSSLPGSSGRPLYEKAGPLGAKAAPPPRQKKMFFGGNELGHLLKTNDLSFLKCQKRTGF